MHLDRFGIIPKNTVFESLISHKSNDVMEYNDSLVFNILQNNIDDLQADVNEYFKSTDKKDLLISGCSLTASIGLPGKHSWSALLFDMLGIEYYNLAVQGDSVHGQIMKIYSYIKKFGKPKYIIAIFPNFERMQIINNPKTFKSKNYDTLYEQNIASGLNKWNVVNRCTANIYRYQNKKDIMKFPIHAELVVNQETAIMYSFDAIESLSQYCKAAGIKFIWSTWDPFSDALIKQNITSGFCDEFITVDPDKWMYNERTHKDTYYKESLFNRDVTDGLWQGNITQNDLIDWYEKSIPKHTCSHPEHEGHEYYETGWDRQRGELTSHFGMHRHIHYAKILYDAFVERN